MGFNSGFKGLTACAVVIRNRSLRQLFPSGWMWGVGSVEWAI